MSNKLKPGEKNIELTHPDGSVTRFGRIENLDRDFDLKYWQSKTSEERFDASWELVRDYHLRKGGKEDELRLQRTIGNLKPFPG